MALPKVSTPTYELTIPSSGEKVSYRPFLVKEEKTLLMAMEAGDNRAMSKAMQDIITSCTEGEVDLKSLASFDIEYFFLQLRGRSIGEILTINPRRPTNFKCCEEATEEDICEININILTNGTKYKHITENFNALVDPLLLSKEQAIQLV